MAQNRPTPDFHGPDFSPKIRPVQNTPKNPKTPHAPSGINVELGKAKIRSVGATERSEPEFDLSFQIVDFHVPGPARVIFQQSFLINTKKTCKNLQDFSRSHLRIFKKPDSAICGKIPYYRIVSDARKSIFLKIYFEMQLTLKCIKITQISGFFQNILENFWDFWPKPTRTPHGRLPVPTSKRQKFDRSVCRFTPCKLTKLFSKNSPTMTPPRHLQRRWLARHRWLRSLPEFGQKKITFSEWTEK